VLKVCIFPLNLGRGDSFRLLKAGMQLIDLHGAVYRLDMKRTFSITVAAAFSHFIGNFVHMIGFGACTLCQKYR
jgi:hypothetical protein